MTNFIKTSNLASQEHSWIKNFLKDKPWYNFYYQNSLNDLKKGLDNRTYLISKDRKGMILAIHFDDVSIYTTVGRILQDELLQIITDKKRIEAHIVKEQVDILSKTAADRFRRQDLLKYYKITNPQVSRPDSRCEVVEENDFPMVEKFFKTYYPETVLSKYMLEQPFVMACENDQIIAAAGTLTIDHDLQGCHVGNFLTHPDYRGKGIAKIVANALFLELKKIGINDIRLGVFETNRSAWRAYEKIGFKLLESRPMLYLNSFAHRARIPNERSEEGSPRTCTLFSSRSFINLDIFNDIVDL